MDENSAIKNLQLALTSEGARFILDPQMTRFRAPVLGEVLAFWRSKAGPDGVPFRRDFTPQSMRSFLSNVALFEVVRQVAGPNRIRARLTGPEFGRTFSDMSLKCVDEVVPEKFYKRWTLIFDTALSYRRPFRSVFVPEAFDREHSVAEFLLAPLLDEVGEQNQFVVAINLEFGASWDAVYAAEATYLKSSSVG